MTRYRDVALAAFESGQSKMAAGLAGHPIAKVSDRLREIVAGDGPRSTASPS